MATERRTFCDWGISRAGDGLLVCSVRFFCHKGLSVSGTLGVRGCMIKAAVVVCLLQDTRGACGRAAVSQNFVGSADIPF